MVFLGREKYNPVVSHKILKTNSTLEAAREAQTECDNVGHDHAVIENKLPIRVK